MQDYVEQREGGYYITGTRISLDSVVYPFKNGASPESILLSFPQIGALEKVYGAITFYLANKESVEAYLRDQERLANEIEGNQSPLPESLAAKLRRAREEALPRPS
jgi:uncharacterized protein (DUF433 family)